MEYREIDLQVDEEGVARLTLDRPDALNAFTPRMARELLDALDRIDEDDDVRVVVVTGRGRAFCAGADLSAGGATFDADAAGRTGGADGEGGSRAPRDGGGLVTLRIFERTKPIIAAINGPAVGIGITMTLAMDIRMAAEDARLGFVFARGSSPDAVEGALRAAVARLDVAINPVAPGATRRASPRSQC